MTLISTLTLIYNYLQARASVSYGHIDYHDCTQMFSPQYEEEVMMRYGSYLCLLKCFTLWLIFF